MGDVLTLIDKAQQSFDEKKAAELEKKIRDQKFTLEDYLEQLSSLKKMGSLDQLLSMMPGMNTAALKDAKIDENMIGTVEAIILSMTPKERDDPEIINYSRKTRIANGSGTSVEAVNRLLKQFSQMKKLMKQFTGPGKKKGKFRLGGMPFNI